MRKILSFALINLIVMNACTQKTITFQSLDGLPVTADLYESKKTDPWLVLFHQADFSRGEYKETAEKFVKLGYNCLAVDLRSGNEIKYIKNKTAEAAREKGLPTEYTDAKQDMEAAIDYAFKQSQKPVVILGSSYSASLSLVLAKTKPNVNAVIAFSPGEYFDKANFIRDSIQGLAKPVFGASSVDEYSYMVELFSKVNQGNLTLFRPSKGNGVHGSRALWLDNSNNNEYWLALLLFFDQIKE
jgi:dienelactone hydrolase